MKGLKQMNIYKEALEEWGIVIQMMKAMEEMAELTVELSQCFTKGKMCKQTIAEEIADVEIMCTQLRIIVGSERVDTWKIKKLKRLKDILDKEKKKKKT
jgi:hypothetical protein